jgi:signal peptidase I
MLLPTQLGGSTSVVRAVGRSMEPAIHAGDLAVLRRQPQYQVGDVTAYHSTTLGETTLHRIVARTGDSYTTRGDNNAWLDPDRPSAAQITGRQWVLIPHGGVLLTWLSLPMMILIAVAAGLLSSSARRAAPATPGTGQRRTGRGRAGRGRAGRGRAGRGRAGRGRAGSPARHGRRAGFGLPVTSLDALPIPTAPGFVTGCVVLALAAVLLGYAAFSRPLETSRARAVGYQDAITFDYEGRSGSSTAYPNGVAGWGDPVYTRLIGEVRVTARNQVSGPQLGPIAGRLTLAVRLQGSNGWRGSLSPDVSVPLAGTVTTAEVPVAVTQVSTLAEQVHELTGAELGPLTIVVQATATPELTVAGRPASSAFTSTMSFRVDAAQLVLLPRDRTATASNTVYVPVTEQAHLNLLGLTVPVWLARLASIVLAVLAFAGAGAVAFFSRHPPAVGFEMAHRYRERLVEVQDGGTDLPVVDLTSARDLYRLADETGAVVLHYGHPGQEEGWMLEHGATRYRFVPGQRRSEDSTNRTPP